MRRPPQYTVGEGCADEGLEDEEEEEKVEDMEGDEKTWAVPITILQECEDQKEAEEKKGSPKGKNCTPLA